MQIGLIAAVTNHSPPIAPTPSSFEAQDPQSHALMLTSGLKAGNSRYLTQDTVSGTFASRNWVDAVQVLLKLYKAGVRASSQIDTDAHQSS